MRRAITILILCFASSVLAHDVDILAPDGPTIPRRAFGLKDADFAPLVRENWHFRRELELIAQDYSLCMGRAQAYWQIATLKGTTGNQMPPVNLNITRYWDVIPSRPVIDAWPPVDNCDTGVKDCTAEEREEKKAAAIQNAHNHTQAAMDGIETRQVWLDHCLFLESLYFTLATL